MKKSFIFILFFMTASFVLQSQVTVIKAKGYLDVKTGKIISPALLVIEKGLITAINPKEIPEKHTPIDLESKILLPGLIDTHVHLDANFVKNHAFLMVTENTSKRTLRAVKNAETTLLAGFTTVRNIGQLHPSQDLIDVALSEASDGNLIDAPRIIPSGHMIGSTGGHADLSMFGGFSDGVLDLGYKIGKADGVEEVLKATRYQIKYGAKSIKIMATAGVTSLEKSLGAQQMTFEEMQTVVDEAARHGIKVAAHAHGSEGIISAVKAGVASIEHGTFLDAEGIKLMKEKGVFLVPTLALQEQLKFDELPAIIAKKARIAVKSSHENCRKAVKAGVAFALGSDAPILPHGENAKEFQSMVKVGLNALQAIQAGTINATKLLGLEDRGMIKEGLLADIVAVDVNPLENIETLQKVKFVMKNGKVYLNKN